MKGATTLLESAAHSDRFRRHALQPEEAQQLILTHTVFLETERIPLAEAWGRCLAEDLIAPQPFPPFRRSGMDGYAVRVEDLQGADGNQPVTLEVTETIPCGVKPNLPISNGQAARIMTGGMVPEGADAVIMLEMTVDLETEGQSFVQISRTVPLGRNIAEIGCEIVEKEMLLAAGSMIGAGESALLAACGYAVVPVIRRPRVAVISTGSELLEVHEPLVPAKIRNTNSPMLAAMLREAGAEPIMIGKVSDDPAAAQELIAKGLRECDLVLTTGGVSVGDYDVMVDVLAAPEFRLLFNKIAMRPGSPTTAALQSGKLIVALSGNPGACFVGFHLFVKPALRAMQRSDQPAGVHFTAYLGADFPKMNAYRRYIRGRTELSDGTVWVIPTGDDKSSLMTTIIGADCLIEIPPIKEAMHTGDKVKAWRLE